MSEIRTEKNELRARYKALRSMLSREHGAERDKRICERILSLVSYRYADTLMLYSPIGSEIDVSPIVRAAFKSGKRVAYPRCIANTCEMRFHYVDSVDMLKHGSYGILEPDEDTPVLDKREICKRGDCICIIPALVYDRRGYRVGYGKGYYDRYLSDFKGTKLGVTYSELLLDELPHGRYDLHTDLIVTERGVNLTSEN